LLLRLASGECALASLKVLEPPLRVANGAKLRTFEPRCVVLFAPEPSLRERFDLARADSQGIKSSVQLPTESDTHFFMWLVFAAPASFFATESASHDAFASVSHFFMKDVSAAPASFFSAAWLLQDAA
jgi:hypothetical protein